mgnify:FL=1
MEKESFWKKYRDNIIVGIVITVIGGTILILLSGAGTSIYNKFFDDKKIKTSTSYQLPATNLFIQGYQLTNLSTTTAHSLLDKVRSEHKVRPLVALESGKKLVDVPVLTYSFLFSGYLHIEPYEDYKAILNGIANRFNSYSSYFEIHKLSEQEIYLLGFSSEESYVNINNPKVEGVKSITLFPYPDIGKDYLLIIPIEKIIKSADREITLDDRSRIGVLDLDLSSVE